MNRSLFSSLLLAGSLVFSAGCTTEDTDSGSSGESGSFKSDCGTVYNGKLKLPVDKGSAQKGTVTVLGSNLLLFKSSKDTRLVKLHNLGVQSEDAKTGAAKNRLSALAAEGEVYYYQASKDCETEVESGALGSLGQFYSAKGTNFSEALINAGLAKLDTDECSGELLSKCYSALGENAQETVKEELEEFLWKPVSDSNGKLAVHTGPYDTSVIVSGERGTDQGPGNGFGSLARFSKPGCAYGANVKVKVIDSESGAAYTFNGSDTITIPNGCNRYCIKNGSIQLCPKK